MSHRDPKKKKKSSSAEVLSWRRKKELADVEEAAVGREVEELVTWTTMIEAMDDSQLKDYVLNHPESKQSTRAGKGALGKKVRRSGGKSRSSSSSASQGLMAAIWKFHRDDEEEASITVHV